MSVGKHEVLLKEDATVIRERMDALFKSLTTMLKTSLIKSKGRFDEEELRAVFAEGNQTARRGSRGSPRASSFAPFLDGQERGPAEQKLTLFGRWDKITVRMFAAERN